ncbi:hypothetical protein [Wenyingzhuangia sp. 2_MG-2023]|uniref:hypothetical protein n=1 Tax=Wenyingzhuangia sp. 2_MG-2023 TaxID=3062639 RepID=UPI0026E1F918|nr:hypothetical protein [Wenyingzhuangia sp. 2_MG-2023]MDO6737603.1 hypothetical protein [Wenyingzhuangia sp. 2_MG-2023]MDO6802441.1 hypothetical protein [Wenyingzhuangia sp. 1_MG-2023]
MKKTYQVLSILLHPVLLPTIAALVYLNVLPMPLSSMQKYMIFFIVIGGTFLVPLCTLLILRMMGYVKTNDAKTIEERKFPVFLMIFNYLFLGQVLQSIWQMRELTILAYATAIGLFAVGILFYAKIKVSLHMLGMTGLLGFVLVYGASYGYSNILVAFLVMLTGALATARLSLKAHNSKEIWIGASLGLMLPIVLSFVL